MIPDTKSLIDNQISKIFTIIEKSSDNPEISKIAIETLTYKCAETPVFIYPIMSNLIQMVIKGNSKGLEDSALLLESFFEDFNSKVFNKILLHDLFKNQLKEIIEDPNDISPSCFIININNEIKAFNEITYVDFSIFETGFDINKLECLYAKDKDSPIRDDEKAPFNQMEINVLFMNDDETRKEVEKSLKNNNNLFPIDSQGEDSLSSKKTQKERLALKDYYLLKEKQYKLDFTDNTISSSGIKKRKLENNTQIIYEIKLCPFYSFLIEILKYNSMNYKQRTCSITLLRLLHHFYDKILYGFYSVKFVYSTNTATIDDIIVDKTITYSDEITKIIQKNLISKMIVNSILDKVIDYTNDDYICISKELNLKMASLLLIDTQSIEINTELSCLMMGLLDKFFAIKKDWQPLFAVLTLFKYLFLSPSYVTDKGKLFHLLSKLMTTDSDDILNLTIEILDKMLEANLLSNFIEKEELNKVFSLFLKLINRYDDIESGIKYYFSCLYHFILFFIHDNSLQINSLVDLLNNDFTFHSMNKIINVRIKYFEVINNLLIGKKNSETGIQFPIDFIEQNSLIAFQGLCIEEDKQLLKIQQTFLMNVIMYDESYINIFINHRNNIFDLFLCDNLTDLKKFYIPSHDKYDRKEIEEVYRGFFLNQMQTDLIVQVYERKLFYIIPILSLILKIKIDFIQVIDNQLKINFNENIVIKENILILLKIYLYYLEFIESDMNKVFILNDDLLKKMSENVTLSELSIKITKMNVETFIGIRFKHFFDFSVNKLGKTNLIVNALYALYKKLTEEYTLNLKEMNEAMKNVYDSIKQSGNNESLKHCCELVKNLKDGIETVEHNQNLGMLRQKIRGYSSACLFIHSIYSNVKYTKISSITNSFLNCLKLNNKESKVFVKYILKFVLSLDNTETISKIIFTFIENSIKTYYDHCNSLANQSNESMNNNPPIAGNNNKDDDKKLLGISNYVFLPMKYFFGEFAKFQKYDDIQKIVSDYQTNLMNTTNTTTPSNICMETKMIVLLYLLSSIKHEVNCIQFNTFSNILVHFAKFKDEPNLVSLISIILINCGKLFSDINNQNDLKSMLSQIYNSIDFKSKSLEYNTFIFQVIDKISSDNIISTSSIDYIFIILHYINNKNDVIRGLAITIFSKLMKIISMLKFETNYEDIAKSTSVVSLDFITKIFTQNIYDIKELKVSIKESLRNYQLIGINWLLFLGGFGLGLALCDDMGLGKTIQTLTAITHASIEYIEKNEKSPCNLIVCPSTLILNWVLESKKFFSEKDLVLIPIENTHLDLKNSKHAKVTIFITSYEKVRDNFNTLFTSGEFFYLILDEAHIIKNTKSKTYGSIRKISAERRIILTGTPIQNNVMELWALFNFLMPGFLGNENDFDIKYQKKIHSNIKKLNLEEKLQENIFQTSLSEIRKRIKPFVLRRLKSDVLRELPDKIILDYNCEMIPSQRELYNKWMKIYENPNNKESSLGIIDKLRKVCNHPLLLEKEDSSTGSIFNITQNPSTVASATGKFKSLEELLISLGFEGKTIQDPLSYENKLLIFTQYKHMCHLLKIFLEEKFSSLNVIELTSDTKVKDRASIVMRFNSDPTINILLLTTSIGGLGINLTSANIVIMYDHNWNPTVDMQAIDRAHRIGQKKTVQVFRLITLDSIEEQLISLQTFKKYIANNVVDSSKISDKKVETGSIMESFECFSNEKNNTKKQKKGMKKKFKLEEAGNEMETNAEKEELEIDYLKSLINKK